MRHMAPVGPIYQAGTLSGNPIAMTAGLLTLSMIERPGFYEQLKHQTEKLTQGMTELAQTFDIPFQIKSIESIFGIFFSNQEKLDDYDAVAHCDIELFKKFFHGMLEEGIYLAPSAFEAGFISSAHGDHEIELTLAAAKRVFEKI